MRAKLAAALIVLLFPALAMSQALKIAVVDVQKVILTVPDGKAAKAKLERNAKKKQKALDKQQKDLLQMKEDLERKASLMAEAAKKQQVMAYQQKVAKLQEDYMKMQQELKEQEAKTLKPIFDKVQKAIKAVAKKDKYTLVLEKTAGVLFAEDALDVTDKVIKSYK